MSKSPHCLFARLPLPACGERSAARGPLAGRGPRRSESRGPPYPRSLRSLDLSPHGKQARFPFSRRMRARAMPRHFQERSVARMSEAKSGNEREPECRSRIALRLSGLRITTQIKKEAERRQTRIHRPHHRRAPLLFPADAARARAERARLSAFHHGACCGERTPQLSSRYALPGTWSGRTIPMVRKIARFSTGVTRSFLSQSSECPRRPVIMPAGRIFPEPPGSGGDEPPPAGTAFAPPPGVTGWRPLRERDSGSVTGMGTNVKQFH